MEQTRSYDRQTIGIFWQAAMRSKRELANVLLYPLGTVFLNIMLPFYIGKILATLAKPHADISGYIRGFIVAGLLGLICNRVGFVAIMRFQAAGSVYLQEKTLQVLLRRSVGFHNNNISGKLVSDAADYPTAFIDLTNAVLINMVPFLIILVGGLAIVFYASWVLGLIIGGMTVFTLLSSWIDSRRRLAMRLRRQAAAKKVIAHLADTIVNIQTVKTFAGEERELKESRKLNGLLLKLRLHDWSSAAITGNNRMAGLLVLQLVYILLITKAVHQNPGLLAVGIFAFSLTITISNRLFEINSMIRSVEESFLKASTMTEIMLQQPEINDVSGATELNIKNGEIKIDNVNFQYEDENERVVFKDLNLDIKAGEKVGLVGPSGGGKSTLTRLLLRFVDIKGGQIAIDGQDIAHLTQNSLRQAISYVPQEPLLFHRTIRENIAYGLEEATTDQIINAAKLAHAHEFIEELPNQYETVVGERGVKLSGGQRQRIAIARAILKDARILILDEATSALDSESEVLIQDALWKLMKGRTAIVIAHRLSTIQKMDRIIVMADGLIIEEGSHKKLIEQNGLYARLWAHQSGGFLED